MKKSKLVTNIIKTTIAIATVAALGHVANAQDPKAPAAQAQDLVSKQSHPGYWKVIGCEKDGEWLHPTIFQHFRYDLKSESFYIHRADFSWSPNWVGSFPHHNEGAMHFNHEENTVDLIPSGGPNKGKVYKGIFDLDHDILKANFAFPGNPRPTTFTTKKGQVYEVWQRLEHPKSY